MTDVENAALEMLARHRDTYVGSGGREGHIWDFSMVGGHAFTPTLLVENFGRKSGERRITPLIYGIIGGEVAIIASKGGAPAHPGWYRNIVAADEVAIQIATQAWRARWREAAGEERRKVWQFMTAIYPPYPAYQAATAREIPVLLLQPGEPCALLKD